MRMLSRFAALKTHQPIGQTVHFAFGRCNEGKKSQTIVIHCQYAVLSRKLAANLAFAVVLILGGSFLLHL